MRINVLLILIASIVVALGIVCGDQLLGTKVIDRLMAAVTWHKKDKQKASGTEVALPETTVPVTASTTKTDVVSEPMAPSSATTAAGATTSGVTATTAKDANTAITTSDNTNLSAIKNEAGDNDTTAGQKHQLSASDRADLNKANFIVNGANVLFHNKQYPEAIAETAKALEISERCAYAYHVRAQCYSALGLLKSAAVDYKHAVWAMPERFAWDLGGMTETYIKLHNAQKAADIDSDFIAHYPKSEWGYNARAVAYRSLGEDDKAIADADTALAIDVKQFAARSVRLDILTKKKQYAEAIRTVSGTISYYPGIDWLYLRRADLYENTGDKERAKQDRVTAQRYKSTH